AVAPVVGDVVGGRDVAVPQAAAQAKHEAGSDVGLVCEEVVGDDSPVDAAQIDAEALWDSADGASDVQEGVSADGGVDDGVLGSGAEGQGVGVSDKEVVFDKGVEHGRWRVAAGGESEAGGVGEDVSAGDE